MPSFGQPKFGRTIKVLLSQPPLPDLVLVDWQGGQDKAPLGSLWVTFSVNYHLRGEPQLATVYVEGLSRDTRKQILSIHKQNETRSFFERRALQSGRITIYAGHSDDAGVLFSGDLAAGGVKEDPGDHGKTLVLTAEDSRALYESRFVKRSNAAGVDLATYRQVIALAGDYLSGKDSAGAWERRFPERMIRRSGPNTVENGFVAFGPSKRINRMWARTMGLQEFMIDGAMRFIALDEALLETAVILDEGKTIMDMSEEDLGYYNVRTILDYRFRCGRQIRLRDKQGAPIGAGTFRVDTADLTGSNKNSDYSATMLLRPTVKPELLL
jgi:hypothetical protein